jgi:hypothetical protein
MPTISRGPLTEFCKRANFVTSGIRAGASAAGTGLAGLGKGIWRAAGHVAPNPWARAGLLGLTAVGVGSQVPQLAGRISQDSRFVQGQGLSPRGF